jgi:DNA/RNA endonuclease YhcR with UshA esterase domain
MKLLKEGLGGWNLRTYNNLSEVKYTRRTIAEMKRMEQEVDCGMYSEILVTATEVKLKKEYMACPRCKKTTISQEKNIFQCQKCRMIVDAVPTFIVSLVLADGTGSLEVDAFGDWFPVLLGMGMAEFSGCSPQ